MLSHALISFGITSRYKQGKGHCFAPLTDEGTEVLPLQTQGQWRRAGTGTRVCHTVGLGCPLHHSPHTDQDHPGLCPASLPVATVSMSCQLHVQLTLDSLPLSLHLHPPWPHLLRLYKSLLPHRFPSLASSIQAPHLTYELLKMKALILKLFHSSHDLPGQPTQSWEGNRMAPKRWQNSVLMNYSRKSYRKGAPSVTVFSLSMPISMSNEPPWTEGQNNTATIVIVSKSLFKDNSGEIQEVHQQK